MYVLLVIRAAKIRPTPRDGSFQLLKFYFLYNEKSDFFYLDIY